MNDPLMEPEELTISSSGYTLIPEGYQECQIIDASIDMDYTNKKGVAGWRWEIMVSFPKKSESATAMIWLDNTSAYGQTMIYNLLFYSGVPYEVPDPNLISATTGQPRKSFSKALVEQNIDGSLTFKKEELVERKFLAPVRWRIQCPQCNWGHLNNFKMNSSQCKFKDMGKCYYGDNEKIVADVENDKIFLDVDCGRIQSLTDDFEEAVKESVQEPQPQAEPQPQIPPALQGAHLPEEGTIISGGQAFNINKGNIVPAQPIVPPAQPEQPTMGKGGFHGSSIPQPPQPPQAPPAPPSPNIDSGADAATKDAVKKLFDNSPF